MVGAFLGRGRIQRHVGGEGELKVIRDVVKAFVEDGGGRFSRGETRDLKKPACCVGREEGGHRAG